MRNILSIILLGLEVLRLSHGSVSKYSYAITSPDYEGAVSDEYNTKYKIASKYMHSDLEDKKAVFKECFGYCFNTTNCSTFVLKKDERMCYLTKYDRCKEPRIFLRRIKGFTTYEMKDRLDTAYSMQTCFQECLSNNATSCEDCARIYCSGAQCDKCKKACWEIPLIKNSTYFWVDLKDPKNTYCDSQWQSIFSKGVFNTWGYLFEKEVVLRLEVHFSDNRTRLSFFENFKEDNQKINVGNYLGGDAGNTWEAPFNDKNIITFVNSTCYNFHYNSKDDCNITQIPTWTDQKNNGAKEEDLLKGYVWDICNGTVINKDVYVKNIFFYITIASDTIKSDIQANNAKLECN